MNNTLLFLLEVEDRTAFGNALRIFLATLIKAVYKLFSGAIDLMYDLATFDFNMSGYINDIGEKIFNLLIIFMLFKISISFMTYLVTPDLATDKNKGVQNIIKRILITIILLMSINPIFTTLKELQGAIIEDDIIASVFDLSDDVNTITIGEQKVIGVKMNSNCPSDKYIYTTSNGDRMALLLFRPFLQPHPKKDIDATDNIDNNAWNSVFGEDSDKGPSSYCGVNSFTVHANVKVVLGANEKETSEKIKADIPGPNSAEGFMLRKYYNLSVDEAPTDDKNNGTGTGGHYFYDFNGFIALIAGVVGLLIVISFCFDVVIRSLNLIILQMIAPIPIISYVSPQGKSSEMLGIWGKKVLSVWASLFIRIIILSVAIMLIDGASNSITNNLGFNNTSLLMDLFIILGILMFAKKLPKLLEELFPGLKLDGGFQLNPFKRIDKDALGGKQVLGAGAGLAAAGLGGATNAIHRGAGFFNGKNYLNKNGKLTFGSAIAGLGRNAGRMAGSTIAGATRSGVNAFGRTSKDGKMFSGMWNGYQTAMYSKIQREDNLRKAGLEDAQLGERIAFAAGSAMSDAARYVGVLNAGQREYLRAAELDNEIKSLENQLQDDKLKFTKEKRIALEPYVEYSNYASKIKDKIDNESNVKLAKQMLEDAQSYGNEQDIFAARRILEEAEVAAGKKLLQNDKEVREYTRRLDEIRANCKELQSSDYNYIGSSGEFLKGSIYNTKSRANIEEMNFAKREKEFEKRQTVIDAKKRDSEYIRTHDENSIAKLQNSSRMNKEVQPPGLKPSAAPMQARMTDSSQYSNLDD